jgi:photosystem II stability/assembly factor-like uncharacterized protein
MKCSAITLAVLLLLAPIASAQWIPVPDPPNSFQGIELFLAGDDRIYAGTFNGRVFGSTDHADTWTEIADGLPEADYSIVMGMVIVGDWFIMSRFGLSEDDDLNFRSHRDGTSWSTWEPLAYQDENFSSFAAIGGTLFAVRGGSAIYRTDDFGATWSAVTAPSANSGWKIFARESRLFAAEQITNSGTVYRSDDLGATWTEIGGGLGSSYVCSEIYWQGRLLVCVYHGGGVGSFWSSMDFGDNWEEITTLPTGYNINGMAIAQDGRLAIGAASGHPTSASIWLSDDLVDWEDYTGDLPQHSWPFNSLVAHDGWFFKSGGTTTEYRAPQPAATAVNENVAKAAALELTARPNPFHPKTTLRFVLEEASHVDLSVYNLAGRRVATIVSRPMPAGTRELHWDGRDESGRPLASGVYLARLHTGIADQSLRVVLLR